MHSYSHCRLSVAKHPFEPRFTAVYSLFSLLLWGCASAIFPSLTRILGLCFNAVFTMQNRELADKAMFFELCSRHPASSAVLERGLFKSIDRSVKIY